MSGLVPQGITPQPPNIAPVPQGAGGPPNPNLPADPLQQIEQLVLSYLKKKGYSQDKFTQVKDDRLISKEQYIATLQIMQVRLIFSLILIIRIILANI